jgi:hypothetical protein
MMILYNNQINKYLIKLLDLIIDTNIDRFN